jgi:hypothetical protein
MLLLCRGASTYSWMLPHQRVRSYCAVHILVRLTYIRRLSSTLYRAPVTRKRGPGKTDILLPIQCVLQVLSGNAASSAVHWCGQHFELPASELKFLRACGKLRQAFRLGKYLHRILILVMMTCTCRALQMMRERSSDGIAAGPVQQRFEQPKRIEERLFVPRIGAHKLRIGIAKGYD